MKIRSVDKSMNDILKGAFYKIPRFQRPYSWERENIEDFWNDVFVNSGPDYFIGSMVVYQPTNSDTAYVVDGQQRLTTITMLLAALRNAFSAAGFADAAAGIQALIERPDIDNQDQYSLQTETSYPYFQEYIQSFKKPQAKPDIGREEEALKLTFDFFNGQLLSTIGGIKADKSVDPKVVTAAIRKKLSELRDKLLALKVIYIDLDNEDDAYLIFETMNTRGKDLEPSDLIKSHLTKLLKPSNKNVDISKDFWGKIVDTIEGSEADLTVTTFLHHYWLSRYDYVTVKGLYKDVKRRIGKPQAKPLLDDLVSDAKLYRYIQETTYKKWSKNERPARNSLEALNLFRVKQPLPMLLALMHAYESGDLKLGQVQDMLAAIENFHFLFTAITSQRSSGGISFMYALHARNLLNANNPNSRGKVLQELKVKLKDKLPSYAEFLSNFSTLSYTDDFTKQKKLIQYILSKVDSKSASGVAIDYDEMTIEHIASQSDQGVDSESIGNIGNLLLCESGFNSNQLAAKPFTDKKALLLSSKISLDEGLAKATKWTSTEIVSRANWMAETAFKKVWKM